MKDQDALPRDVVAMVSLAAGIAANHPAMGQCQLGRLRGYGASEAEIAAVIEIARHIRDEAAEKLDFAFDEKAKLAGEGETPAAAESAAPEAPAAGESCGCTPTPSGRSCC